MKNIDGLIDCLLDIKIGKKTKKDFMELLGTPQNDSVMTLNHNAPAGVETILAEFTGTRATIKESVDSLADIITISMVKDKHTESIESIFNDFSDKVKLSVILGFLLPKWEAFGGIQMLLNINENIELTNLLMQYHHYKVLTSPGIDLSDLGVSSFTTDTDGLHKAWLQTRGRSKFFKHMSIEDAHELVISIIGDFGLNLRLLQARILATQAASSMGIDPDSAEGHKILNKKLRRTLYELDIEQRIHKQLQQNK